MNKRSLTASILWDRLGIGISGICILHCLTIPVVLSILPVFPVGADIHGWFHPLFLLLLLPVTWFAMKRSHFQRSVTLSLSAGLFLVLIGWILGHYWLGAWVEAGLTTLGSSGLIAGHWLNYRHHRVCTNSRHKHHPELEGSMEKSSAGNKGN